MADPDDLRSESRPWHALSPEETAERLRADPEHGLSEEDAARRRAATGPNEIERRESFSWPAAAARQLADPLVVVLLFAALIAGAVGDLVDAVAIAVIVVMNGVLGFVQEWRAERTLSALADMLAPTARVVRSGRPRTTPAAEIAPGDLVELAQGDRIPADLKLLAAVEATADESPLTGEAAAVAKHPGVDAAGAPLAARSSMLFAGAVLMTGRARGLVTATGGATEFGRVALSAAAVRRPPTPLERKLRRFARGLGVAALALGLAIVALGFVRNQPLAESILMAASLAVAAVPEGLPAVVALSLAIGVRAMARRRALVRRLRAVEALGSATVICTDKTGTLTTGVMSATTIAVASGDLPAPFRAAGALDFEAVAALETAAICNDAGFDADGRAVGSPTEAALLTAARAAGVDAARAARRLREIPFSSARKTMTVVIERNAGAEAHVKGAPERIVALCARVHVAAGAAPMGEADRSAWLARAARMAEGGLRVVAVARRAVALDDAPDALESGLELLGLIGMKDPLRPGAREAVETTRLAGVRVIMITGDAAETAAAVAVDAGLDHDGVLEAGEIDRLDDRALDERLRTAVVLSRATPEHKLRVVERLQAMGEVVAMTGDGVNDAPALKKADIGVAMGVRGTDAAKAAADIILLDDDFSTIVGAMREGRRQGDNIRKFILFLLTHNVSEVVAVFANVVFGAPLLVRPAQLLWINLVTDGATALALGLEREEPDAMTRPPRRLDAAILDRGGVAVCVGFGLALAAATLWFFHGAASQGTAASQTMAFTALALFPQFLVLSFRSLRSPVLRIGLFGNPAVLAAAAAGIALQVAAVHLWPLNFALGTVPLSVRDWTALAAAGLGFFLAAELGKALLDRSRRASPAGTDPGA